MEVSFSTRSFHRIFGFVDREKEENKLLLEIDFHVGKKQLKQILEKVINTHGATATAEVLDAVKALDINILQELL